MREAELDLFLENFRAIADERMADIAVTPELKERILFAALEAPKKSVAVPAFAGRRVVWGSVAIAAALLIAAIGGSRLLLGGGRNTAESPMEAAASYGEPETSEILESGRFAADEPDADDGAPAGDEAAPEEGEGSTYMLMPPPEPEAPAGAAGGSADKDAGVDADADTGGGNGASGSSKGGGAVVSSRPEEEPRDESAFEDEIVTDDAVEEMMDEETEEEAEDSAIAANDPEADIALGGCQIAGDPMSGVTAVFTGEVVSAQFLTISLKDGTAVPATDAGLANLSPDRPELEGSACFLPVYGYDDGGNIYVVVTSYKVESVYYGGAAAGTVVRVLGAGGTAGAREVVAVSGVENRLSGGIEIRYDLVADYAAILVDWDTSAENVSRITGMIDAG